MTLSSILSGIALTTLTTVAVEPVGTIHVAELDTYQRFAICDVLDLQYSVESEACVSTDSPCEGSIDPDLCAEAGLVYDEAQCTCVAFAPQCGPTEPPPDGGGDLCEELGWYDDGVCDSDCAQPDPDCVGGGSPLPAEEDFCAMEGWYGDGICDADCPEPDPDCGG